MLSSLYSSVYNELMLTPDSDVRELRREPDPGELAALIPDDYWIARTGRCRSGGCISSCQPARSVWWGCVALIGAA